MITDAHLTEATSAAFQAGFLPSGSQLAARKAVTAARHRRAQVVGSAPLAGLRIKLPKIRKGSPRITEKIITRLAVAAIMITIGMEILVAAGVSYSTFTNPGDKGWTFGTETTFVGVDHSSGESDVMLCIDGHLIYGPSCG